MQKNKLVLILLFTYGFIQAQSYSTAVGIRLGTDIGLTLQQHLGNNWTAEALLTTQHKANESRVTVMAERHLNLIGRGFNGYLGAGLHKGFVNTQRVGYEPTFGISTIGGLEWTLKNYSFSLDYRPTINLKSGSEQSILNGYTALSVRYVLIKRETKFQSWKKRQRKRFKS